MGDRVPVTMEMIELRVETLERWRFLLSSVAQPYSHWTAATNSMQGSLVLPLRHPVDLGGSMAEAWNLELGYKVGVRGGCSVQPVADFREVSNGPLRAAAFTHLALRKRRASLWFQTALVTLSPGRSPTYISWRRNLVRMSV
ncbi:Hypothetical predicted protein [Marmota monax]|uniref:Uncharacterized protein n=1 Tax=Marmota monax TaxID=9995 RepID=A0A5E4BXE0_MARMO|nr:Hypothetical predicted protein [Marmota monax]